MSAETQIKKENNMKERVVCPYCGENIIVDIEDWDDVNEVFEWKCEECDKYCMVCASVSWSYYAEKLDCKNGLAEHKYIDVPISSRGDMASRCKVCGEFGSGAGG